jgi:hypothetical protein
MIPFTKNKLAFTIVVLCLAIQTTPANAQWSNYSGHRGGNSSNFFVGFEALTGTRNFSLNSDHQQFNELNVLQEGRTMGVVMGTNTILIKLRQGNYQSDKNVDLKEQTVTFNVSPMQFAHNKPKYFNPYILFGFDNNIISLFGEPLPTMSKQGGNNNNCCCLPPEELPDEDPDLTMEASTLVAGNGRVHVGDLKVLRTNIGAGLMLNFTSKKTFAKLFAEAKYGTQSTSRTSTEGLKNTWSSDQITINAGVIVGLNLAGIGRN